MFSSTKFNVNRIRSEIAKKIITNINKTFSKQNFRQDSYYSKVNFDMNGNSSLDTNKWKKLSRHNNIRSLSTSEVNIKRTMATTFVPSEENREFKAMFPNIVRDLTVSEKLADIPEVTERFAKLLQSTVPTGKTVRGLSTVVAYKMLEEPTNLTSENIKLSYILGWCSELLITAGIIVDDIVDNSEIRRGDLCWYRQPEVGLYAINDAVLINSGIYQLLKTHFSLLPCYVPILELFLEVTFKSLLGQSADTLCMENNKPRLNDFTMSRYQAIVKYKAAYLALYLPVTSSMYLANRLDQELHSKCKTILLEMGHLIQIQDDFIDCFSNIELTKKIGTDIQNGKCTWLAVVALERATPTQRTIMEEHYGRPKEESVQAICNLYKELDLPSIYTKNEEEMVHQIHTHIEQLPKEFPRDLMLKLLNRINKREC